MCGCEKEPPPPPEVEPELQPTLELSVTPEGEIPYGGNVEIRWTADDKTNKVVAKVNGVIKATSSGSASRTGALYLGPLFKDALISVVATNVDLSFEVEKEVHVGDWTTSAFGLVSYFPWRYREFRVSSLGGKILIISPASAKERSWIFYYHKDGKISYSFTEEIASWLIEGDTIFQNREPFKLQVNQNEMILSYQAIYNGETVWFDMVLEHASDTPTDPE